MYRSLTQEEIITLQSRGCSADNWNEIQVSDGFNAERYTNVTFSGRIQLGASEHVFELPGGFKVKASISNAALHNVSVADNVYIHNVGNYIANYNIGEKAFIENVNRIVATGDSTFGIGTEVSVLNETGGREVPIYPRLSAQVAWLVAMYRHKPDTVSALRRLILDEADKARNEYGSIGKCVRIINSGEITDVNIGDYATIDGAAKLSDGTIAASESDPVYVGSNVMAEHFILASGAHVAESVVLVHSFVGQASQLTHLFSAHDSLFFANCACENGEAAAIFAGPYTVTMHKSSLLIAGMFSFLNAGSGSNQSNHMYKLGPIHQGVVERGSKTTSDSYILWPARIGAFSLVMGRHVNHPDTSALPFSYLIENRGRSYLVPGVNIKSVGTIRDARKWPKRDKRRDSDQLDCINFNLLSPYTASKMLNGIKLLDTIEQTLGVTADQYSYRSMTIEARALRKGKEYYRMALDKFMGNSLIHRLRNAEFKSDADICELLKPTIDAGCGEWIDLAGMIAPHKEIEKLSDDIASGKCAALDDVEKRIKQLAADYYDMEWTWVDEHFSEWYGKSCQELTAADIADIVERWRNSVVTLDKMLYEDARKEFSLVSRIGFGADGSVESCDADFEQVRGDFD
ncbi:MAG: DUF4954 family protein, partial [Muribaculaceae bacterium]|nr:DUF4954 family protein [Muribaculaceae bacterium]